MAANPQAIPAPTPYAITTQDGNSRVWERTVYETDPSGQIVPKQHHYTEMASGLNHLVNGQWVESREWIDILPNGTAAATNGQHQAYFPGDIYTGQIELVTPDGLQLNSRPLGLSYSDGQNTVLIATLTNSMGVVSGSNQVIYPDAFTGFKADVRYTYKRGGFEQDIILQEQPPTPESLGLNPATARLQVMTEFFSAPQPTVQSRILRAQAGVVLNDQSLGFGTMQMIPGRAFMLGADAKDAGARVAKQWVVLDGRQFLVEEVPVAAIVAGLSTLPMPAIQSGAAPTVSAVSKHLILPPQRLAKDRPKTGLLARATLPVQGFVLDYQTLNSNQTNYVFQGDTTYYISSEITLFGTNNVFEGGTVIKFNTSGAGMGIWVNQTSATCPFNFQSTSYRPAIFTSINDNSVGETISGSTGNPATLPNCDYLGSGWGATTVIHHARFAYATIAYISEDSQIQFLDCQFIQCAQCCEGDIDDGYMHNVLAVQCGQIFNNSIHGENLTAVGCNFSYCNYPYPDICALTNSLIVASTNYGNILLVNTAQTNNGAGIFQTAAGGNYYLAAGSPYRNAGTTNINPVTLADIATKTTYPPLIYSNVVISANTTLNPQAQRDTDTPDLGYHYDPLDYAFGGCTANSNLTFTAGTAVGWFRTSSGWDHAGYGIDMGSGVTVAFNGTATVPAYWVRLNTVQEQDLSAGYGQGGIESETVNVPTVTGNFLRCSALAGEQRSYFADDYGIIQARMVDCEFWGGSLDGYGNYMFYTNCLMQRVNMSLWNGNATTSSLTLRNCTFIGGLFYIGRNSSGPTPVSVRDSAFDGTTISTGDYWGGNSSVSDYDYNAYTNSPDPFSIGGTHDVVVTNFNWRGSWLGNYYQPTNSLLIDKGDTNANLLGLYQFTTQTNQVKEANTIVDIGYHYVAVDANGNPLDTNGDGIPDYLEDANGNGLVDSGEIGWNITGDLGLKVLITRPRNGSILP